MSNERFKRILFDGGLWFGDDYVSPVWAIHDTSDEDTPVKYLEFRDEYKDLCDELCEYLNDLCEEKEREHKRVNYLKKMIAENCPVELLKEVQESLEWI